jgi:hypothetical protein
MVNAMKPRGYKNNVEDAAILSLMVSLTLALLTIFGWAMWAIGSQFVEPVLPTASIEIP